MRGEERRGLARSGFRHAAEVLDGGDTGAGGRHGIGEPEMTGDSEIEGPGFVEDRLEQRRIDAGVDLQEVGTGIHQPVDTLACVSRAIRSDGVGIRHREPIQHGRCRVGTRSSTETGVERVAEPK